MSQFNTTDPVARRLLLANQLKMQQAEIQAKAKIDVQRQLAQIKSENEQRNVQFKVNLAQEKLQQLQIKKNDYVAQAKREMATNPRGPTVQLILERLNSPEFAPVEGSIAAAALKNEADTMMKWSVDAAMTRASEEAKLRGVQPSAALPEELGKAIAGGTSIRDVIEIDITKQQALNASRRAENLRISRINEIARKLKLNPEQVANAVQNAEKSEVAVSGMKMTRGPKGSSVMRLIKSAASENAAGAVEASRWENRVIGGLKRNWKGIGIAGAAGLGAYELGKAIFGSDNSKQQIAPEIQMLLAQRMAQSQGDDGMQSSRTMRDMARLLTMIKTLQGMAGTQDVQQSPPVASLV